MEYDEDMDIMSSEESEASTEEEEEDIDAKRELAIRLMEGNDVPLDQPKAVALLEDCVALGDAEAMLVLANCCVLGNGMERDAERAESLISEAAKKGNKEALCLMKLINDWKGQQSIDLSSLVIDKRISRDSSFWYLSQEKPRANGRLGEFVF